MTSTVVPDVSIPATVSVLSLFVLTVDSVTCTVGVSVVRTGLIVYRFGGLAVEVRIFVVGGNVSVLDVCVVLASTVVSVATIFWVDFFVFGGEDEVGRIDGVVLILLWDFRARVVGRSRSCRVVRVGVSSIVVCTVGGCRSAGGSRLVCLGVLDGGKK